MPNLTELPESPVLAIPRFGLVVLMGPAASGKSTFARRWFTDRVRVSIEQCSLMVLDQDRPPSVPAEAYALLETWVTARLKLGRLTVVDAPALEPRFRLRMLDLAREFHAPAILLALETPLETCQQRDRDRAGPAGPEEIGRDWIRFSRALQRLREEGWNRVVRLSPTDLEQTRVEIRPLRVDCDAPPPYDLIGDIHGCYVELCELLERLGYRVDEAAGYRHPSGRRVVFVGDLIDRGPASLAVLRLVLRMHRAGTALVTPGNHDNKLVRHFSGVRVRADHGFERTLQELEALSGPDREAFQSDLSAWLRSLPPYLLLDQGRLVVAHAGLPEHLQGRLSRSVAAWALFGEARSHRPPPGQPERVEWASAYQGRALVIYGHTPSGEVRRRGNTLCIDQGCVFGGHLTAYRYPEDELVHVRAHETYYPDDAPDLEGNLSSEEGSSGAGTESPAEITLETSLARLEPPAPDQVMSSEAKTGEATALPLDQPQGRPDVAPDSAHGPPSLLPAGSEPRPDLTPLMEGVGLENRFQEPLPVRPSDVAQALEHLVRRCVDARWLVYVPPLVVPCNAGTRGGFIEHPGEALHHYRSLAIPVSVEEMPLGTRVVVIVGLSDEAIEARFGIRGPGMLYDRLGVPVMSGVRLQTLLEGVREGLVAAGAFARLSARVLIFEATLQPWRIRNEEHLMRRALPAAAALQASRSRGLEAIEQALARRVPLRPLREAAARDREAAVSTMRALGPVLEPVPEPAELKLAPHQLLASDNACYVQEHRAWQVEELERWTASWGGFVPIRRVMVQQREQEGQALALWDRVGMRGAGMVVRSLEWLPLRQGRVECPAMQVRGKDMLRLLYGPQCMNPEQIAWMRERPLRQARVISAREWVLATEGLMRFADGARFAAYHPYALAVLASQCELQDPRV